MPLKNQDFSIFYAILLSSKIINLKKIVIFIYLCLIASIASARLPMPPEWQVISNIQGASLDVDGYSEDLIKEKLLLVYRLK